MITEDFVSFKVANLLKEKGFDEKTGFVYSENGELMKLSDFGVRYLLNSECDDYPHWQFPIEGVASIVSAPTIQMAMKWLRYVQGIDISIDIRFWTDDEGVDVKSWRYTVYRTDEIEDFGQSDTYEEACEEAIRFSLENLI